MTGKYTFQRVYRILFTDDPHMEESIEFFNYWCRENLGENRFQYGFVRSTENEGWFFINTDRPLIEFIDSVKLVDLHVDLETICSIFVFPPKDCLLPAS